MLNNQRYGLAPHVYGCRTSQHVVFLDLKKDQYVACDASASEWLNERIAGWPDVDAKDTLSTLSVSTEDQQKTADEFVQELLAQGMIIPCGGEDTPRRGPVIERPEVALIDGYEEVKAPIRLRDVLLFIAAAVHVASQLRWRSLEQVMNRIRSRGGGNEPVLDRQAARLHMAVFNRLRPLLFTENSRCLFASLVAHQYLAYHNISPTVVLGVMMNPFEAHCWLQHGKTVVNDIPEYMCEYTPIFAARAEQAGATQS